MFFDNRRHAGELLAEKLAAFRDRSPLILAVPRGGVAVALPVWRSLGGVLDLLITRKIGAPYQPELAIGAVSGEGFVMLNESLVAQLRVSRPYLDRTAKAEQAEIERRLRLYRGDRPAPEINGKVVILIDDGVATGFTLMAALKGLRRQKPDELALAVPVGPPDTLARLQVEVDALYYLAAPQYFSAVGQFYRDFTQTTDEEVIAALKEAWEMNGER
jgi:putative phosphoribosyl transferase